MLSAKLVVVGGEVKTTEIKLRLPAIIGRGKGSTITLLQPLVSRQHCELFEGNGKLWVRDLGSLNGTYVNNEKVSECELPPNELLTVGTVTFRAIYEPLADGTANAAPVPQFLPSKAREEDEQPTIRVDSATNGDEIEVEEVAIEEVAVEEIEEFAPLDDDEGVPSTPLFAAEPARPAKPAPPRPAAAPTRAAPTAPARPAPAPIPSVVTTDATPAAPSPVTPAPAAESKAESADDDDDLNDFLKSLGKK
jgi:hypothetical protein